MTASLPPDLRIGFIGAGRMAQALAAGVASRGVVSAAQLSAYDPVPAAAERFKTVCGGSVAANIGEVFAASKIVVLAVKPQQMEEACTVAASKATSEHLVVSVAAGVSLEALRRWLGGAPRLARVMPNTPALVGEGATAFALAPGATPEDAERVKTIFSAVGKAFEVKESLLDAVTGLSGSGPAFVYLMIEALSDGGVLCGLPRELATALAAQTVRGAASMVLQTGEHPAVLKDQVASPGGTTIAGLAALERGGLRAALISAVEAASRRSAELGRPAPGIK